MTLWKKFLPHCKDEINRVYDRLDVSFDHTLGESFYHEMLGDVVEKLEQVGLAHESDGAVCVFLAEFDAPMIVRKQDGAYLYATTDLATMQYRLEQFNPSEILYVVDTRQSEHFEKLFAVAHHFGLEHVKLVHVNFGTVLGEDGRPMKTRSGTLIGLESLLDDAVERARQVVCNPERLAGFDPPMDEAEQEMIAEVVGIGAIKFADLSHHRTSDYRFNLDKMVALEGNTSTYVQYSYARTQKILENAEKLESDVIDMIEREGWNFTHPAERALALMLIKLEEALLALHKDYAPNQFVDYLLDTAKAYSKFNDNCHVLRGDSAGSGDAACACLLDGARVATRVATSRRRRGPEDVMERTTCSAPAVGESVPDLHCRQAAKLPRVMSAWGQADLQLSSAPAICKSAIRVVSRGHRCTNLRYLVRETFPSESRKSGTCVEAGPRIDSSKLADSGVSWGLISTVRQDGRVSWTIPAAG